MRRWTRRATALLLVAALVGPLGVADPVAAQLSPTDIGRSEAVLSATQLDVGDELTVAHAMQIFDYPLHDWTFGVGIPANFELVSTSPANLCSSSGDRVECFGDAPLSGGIEIVLRALYNGEAIPIPSGITFNIIADEPTIMYYGSQTDLVDVSGGEPPPPAPPPPLTVSGFTRLGTEKFVSHWLAIEDTLLTYYEVTLDIPAEFEFVSADAAGGVCTHAGGTVTCVGTQTQGPRVGLRIVLRSQAEGEAIPVHSSIAWSTTPGSTSADNSMDAVSYIDVGADFTGLYYTSFDASTCGILQSLSRHMLTVLFAVVEQLALAADAGRPVALTAPERQWPPPPSECDAFIFVQARDQARFEYAAVQSGLDPVELFPAAGELIAAIVRWLVGNPS